MYSETSKNPRKKENKIGFNYTHARARFQNAHQKTTTKGGFKKGPEVEQKVSQKGPREDQKQKGVQKTHSIAI